MRLSDDVSAFLRKIGSRGGLASWSGLSKRQRRERALRGARTREAIRKSKTKDSK